MKLVFNHIPKTGGTSLFSIFQNSYTNYLSLNSTILNLYSYHQLNALFHKSEFIQFHSIELINIRPFLLNDILLDGYFFLLSVIQLRG